MEIPLSTFASSRPELDFFIALWNGLKFPVGDPILRGLDPVDRSTTIFHHVGWSIWVKSERFNHRLCSSECGRDEARLCLGGDFTDSTPENAEFGKIQVNIGQLKLF
jgi:hypothetical protein